MGHEWTWVAAQGGVYICRPCGFIAPRPFEGECDRSEVVD